MNIFRTEHNFSTIIFLDLCLRWHIFRSYRFVVEVTFKYVSVRKKSFSVETCTVIEALRDEIFPWNHRVSWKLIFGGKKLTKSGNRRSVWFKTLDLLMSFPFTVFSFLNVLGVYILFSILGWASVGEGHLFKKLDFLSNSLLSLRAIQ